MRETSCMPRPAPTHRYVRACGFADPDESRGNTSLPTAALRVLVPCMHDCTQKNDTPDKSQSMSSCGNAAPCISWGEINTWLARAACTTRNVVSGPFRCPSARKDREDFPWFESRQPDLGGSRAPCVPPSGVIRCHMLRSRGLRISSSSSFLETPARRPAGGNLRRYLRGLLDELRPTGERDIL